MTISIDTNQRPAMPIPFYQLLTQELLNTSPKDANAITLYFRDPDYSPERGGFHPVEVRLEKQFDRWRLVYVTGFAFHGYELIKDIDICFNSKMRVKSSLSYLATISSVITIWMFTKFKSHWVKYQIQIQVPILVKRELGNPAISRGVSNITF
jgi:hypothetical protein